MNDNPIGQQERLNKFIPALLMFGYKDAEVLLNGVIKPHHHVIQLWMQDCSPDRPNAQKFAHFQGQVCLKVPSLVSEDIEDLHEEQ